MKTFQRTMLASILLVGLLILINACSYASPLPIERVESNIKTLLTEYQVVVKHSPEQDVIYIQKKP